MINIENAKTLFDQYVKNYDDKNDKVVLKINHTYRVVEVSKNIAKNLKLSQEDIGLAMLIGLLHDFGRFEQLRRFDSYIDSKTVDHANLGIEILFANGMIDRFVEDEFEKRIVRAAIYNHNKYKIEEGLDARTLMHCKIIRDSDKIDIFNTGLIESFEAFLGTKLEVLENDVISEQIYQTFLKSETILSTTRKTTLDFWVSFLALIFDLNYQYSYEHIYQHDYINRLVKRIDYKKLETRIKVLELQNHANNYLIDKSKIKY